MPKLTYTEQVLTELAKHQDVPGGCGFCDAVQDVSKDHRGENVWRLVIKHDDDCPALVRRMA